MSLKCWLLGAVVLQPGLLYVAAGSSFPMCLILCYWPAQGEVGGLDGPWLSEDITRVI